MEHVALTIAFPHPDQRRTVSDRTTADSAGDKVHLTNVQVPDGTTASGNGNPLVSGRYGATTKPRRKNDPIIVAAGP